MKFRIVREIVVECEGKIDVGNRNPLDGRPNLWGCNGEHRYPFVESRSLNVQKLQAMGNAVKSGWVERGDKLICPKCLASRRKLDIGGKDLVTNLSHREIVELFHKSWTKMMIQDVNLSDAVDYEPSQELPEEFFLYRDADSENLSSGDTEDNLEGMVYIIDHTIVYESNTPADVKAIIESIPEDRIVRS